MKIKSTYRNLGTIIPEAHKKKLKWFLAKNILFGMLDLVSIAYLTPILVLLFDPNAFNSIVMRMPLLKEMCSSLSIPVFAILFAGLYLIKIVFQTRFNTALYVSLYNLCTDISIENTQNFIDKSFMEHQNLNKGAVLQNVTTVPEDFAIRYLLPIINLITESIILSLLVGVLLLFYFKVVLAAVLLLLAFAVFIYLNKKQQMATINSVYLKTQAQSNAALLNLLDGYFEIKNSGNPSHFLSEFRKEKALLNQVTGKLVAYNSNYAKYLEIVLMVSLVGLVIFNPDDKNTMVMLSVIGASSLRLIPSISRILNALTLMKSYHYAVEILSKNKRQRFSKTAVTDFNSELILENITFSYGDNQLLNAINLKITKGSFIGIKGDSGVGKTTLLYLIMGILEPDEGTISLDRHKIKNKDSLSFVSYVPQQPFLFSGTITDNIVMGQNPALIDHDYLEYLCRKLEIDSVIKKMPDAYQTQITHESLRFSGGQKQRLALVRALYVKPKLLVLDETTNQQDPVLEQKIFSFLKELCLNEQLTIVCVSHNPAVEVYFDSIYEIQQHG